MLYTKLRGTYDFNQDSLVYGNIRSFDYEYDLVDNYFTCDEPSTFRLCYRFYKGLI